MNTIRKRKKSRVFPLILALTLCFSNHFTLVINAENPTQTKKELEDNLSKLNKDKDSVSKELSDATASLRSAMSEISDTQKQLGTAKAREIGQYEMMKKRIKYIYESSSGDFMSMLLEAESIADLLNRADFVSSVSEYDRSMLEKLQQIHNDIKIKEQLLLEQQKNLEAQKKVLSGKYKELTSMVADASNDLAAYEKELAAAEAAAKASEEMLNKKKPSNENKKPADTPADKDKPENTPDKKPDDKPAEKPEKPAPPSNVEDVALFAGILECEAGSSNYDALLAVATVIMNRLESSRYPDTLSGVIYQSGQFSPTWTGKLDKVLARGPKSLCYTVAKDALAGSRHDAVRSCYSFRASWTGVSGITIGGNTFF